MTTRPTPSPRRPAGPDEATDLADPNEAADLADPDEAADPAGPNEATDPIAAVSPPEAGAERLGRLHDRLAHRAEAAGLLDLACRVVDSPVGPLLVAVAPSGVVRIAFDREDHDAVTAELAEVVSPRILRSPARTDAVAAQIEEYFAGRRRRFDLAVDLRLARGFRRTVLDELRQVPYGRTATYGSLARAAGSPAAVRAVGAACATNPIPIVVPCHRVLRSDGTIGGYRGGPEAKALLLRLEAGEAVPWVP